MSNLENRPNPPPPEPKCRPVGGTEYSWCKAVPGGTGITVLALVLSKHPDISLLQNALHRLQTSHPNLRSKLRHDTATGTFSYVTPTTPALQIQPFDLQSTAQIVESLAIPNNPISPFQLVLEHEMNWNEWTRSGSEPSCNSDADVFFASLYTLSDSEWVVALRLHTSVCDRTSAVSLLRELLGLIGDGAERGLGEEEGVNLAIEDLIPSGKANKPFWARGVDMLGYSLNSFRFQNLNFMDTHAPRGSRVVRLQMNSGDTDRILTGCKSKGIKLCGLLAAAGLIAAHSSKNLPGDQWEKYAVVTLVDCRSLLDPLLDPHNVGFYHSAILNTHNVKGDEGPWGLAKRTYASFASAKENNKHFSDMADINFLMTKAIDNPGLTPSSSMRTSFISVFEEPIIDDSHKMGLEIGLEDYVGCSSVHGVGPSMAIFDTIRAGELDCACVYPWPLHSREQMQELVDDMKRVLVDCAQNIGSDC